MGKFLFFLFYLNSLFCYSQENIDLVNSKNSSTTDAFLSWKIKVKGIASTKEYTFSGGPNDIENYIKQIGEKIKASSATDEDCSIEMTFNFTDVVLTDTLAASKIKKFLSKHFEVLSNCEIFNYDFPEWSSPFYNNAVITAEIDKKKSQPEGKGCLKLEGTDENRDGYICSFTKYFKNIYSSNSSVMTSVKSDAKNTWIFFYAYGQGNPLDAIQLLISEGSPNGLMDNEAIIGFYTYEIPLDFAGWKQFAIRYSDLKPTIPSFVNDNRKKFGEQGDQILDPKELMGIQYTLVSKTPGVKTSVWLDKLMILYNQ